jgi:hypothetical protein
MRLHSPVPDRVTLGSCIRCLGTGNYITWNGQVMGKCYGCGGTGEVNERRATPRDIDVSAIELAFARALREGVADPLLRLGDFSFTLAPAGGNNAGAIYAKRGRRYLGKIKAGRFHPGLECEEESAAAVARAASDPAAAAVAYGLRTGRCSCCGRTLTNRESVSLGIGPICKERFFG